MAIFINASKGLGFLKYLEVERKNKKNPFQDLQQDKQELDDLKSEMIICHHERIVSEKFDTYREEEEDKKFWMNLVKPSKTEIDIVSSIKIRLKIVETFIAIISLTSLIFTQFEYELEYSPKMIFDCQGQKPCNYQGNIVRVLVSIMCFFLALMAVYVSYLSYKMKKEQKKIINSKNKK